MITKRGVGRYALERRTDELVDLEVAVDDGVGEGCVGHRVVGRVLRVHRPPHHVRHLVEVAEVIEQKAALEVVEHVVELLADLPVGDRGLRHEGGVVEHAVGERVGVFRHALGVEAPGRLGELGGVARRRGNRHGRRQRIEVER